MLLTNSVLLAAPVVDIDGTFYIQGGLFLLMVFLLNGLLFKPWLEVQARRKSSIEGALEKAEQLQLDARDKGAKYDADLRDARESAMELRSDARKEGEAASATRLGEAREEARKSLEDARAKIQSDAGQARSALGGRVDELARDITTKILGRSA